MKNRPHYLRALLLTLPSLFLCALLVRQALSGLVSAPLSVTGVILCILIGGATWQSVLHGGVAERVVHMPLYDLLVLLNERSDIHEIVINELEGTDYHEEPEEDA